MTSFDEFDEGNQPRENDSDFSKIINHAVNRRSFLKSSAAFGLSAFVVGGTSSAFAKSPISSKVLGFSAVPANTHDTVTVPEGYSWEILISWGDPLFSKGVAFNHDTRGTGTSQELAFGDNNDGMNFFPLSDGEGVMVVNNEYANRDIICPSGINTQDDVRKVKAAHGVSVFNVKYVDGRWSPQLDGQYNRRITADTPMEITGPARGHVLLKTQADPTGTTCKGTWNNCGNGRTPWGTYLACEENFNGYFASTNQSVVTTDAQNRYGVGNKDWGYNWFKFDSRFDISKEPNECNRAGYVVELDPMKPNSMPKKRTALGRFKHENAELVIADNGKVVVYLGDDERGEYLYRFISKGFYKEGETDNNAELLAEGIIYVARFGDADNNLAGIGEWLELTPGKNGLTADAGFASSADVCIHTRMAASTVGATTMDRPEWIAAHPSKAQVFCALSNNKNRAIKTNSGGDATPVGGPNPRAGNLYGQIVRWRPAQGDHTADTFAWDLFVLAGNPTVHQGLEAGGANVTPDNMFNSPDGLSFDPDGRLWIQTDGQYTDEGDFAGMGNNQMLCGDTETGEVRRFLVGPNSCEITGATWSADFSTMFVGIQHPGEREQYPSTFPGGKGATPRSSIVAIRRNNGGVIGG